ncbi:hypothetical protein [Pseudomonas sp. RIT-To-2]|uniref:hypothetical protein n=1 Tax=Pseudomonas sp. RIT-To-2 TaxID=3462541 RepID=UPI00241397F2
MLNNSAQHATALSTRSVKTAWLNIWAAAQNHQAAAPTLTNIAITSAINSKVGQTPIFGVSSS